MNPTCGWYLNFRLSVKMGSMPTDYSYSLIYKNNL